MKQQTIEQLKEMRLTGFVQGIKEQEESNQYHKLSFDERLAFIVDKEFLIRKSNRLKRTIKKANLKQQATVEEVDFDTPRRLNRAEFMELVTCNWITKHHNLVIVGPTGNRHTGLRRYDEEDEPNR